MAILLGMMMVLGVVFNQAIFIGLFFYGYSKVYDGEDDYGNNIMAFSISKLKKPSSEIYHAYSVLNTKHGNYAIAMSALAKAYRMNPKKMGAYYGWVLLYYYHEYAMALKVLNTYDAYTPNQPDYPMGECIHYLKGLALSQLGQHTKALTEFDTSIAITTARNGVKWVDYQVFVNKGLCLFKLGRYPLAIGEFNRALSIYPKCSEAYYYIALSQIKLHKPYQACVNLSYAKTLINKGYKSSDTYVELFHEIYPEQVEQAVIQNCQHQ